MSTAGSCQQPLATENTMDLLILLLYAAGKSGQTNEPVEGVTRVQKLFFLLQQKEYAPDELAEVARKYEFEPYKMGPFTGQLQTELDELQSAGIVRMERLKYWLRDDSDPQDGAAEAGSLQRRVESCRFSLTVDWGEQIAKDLWAGLTPGQRQGLSKFKSFFNSLSLRQLLIFVYEKFPKYAVKSTIKDQLGLP